MEQFAWRHYYWYLTNEGIQYLRDYLHLPSEIVPSPPSSAPCRVVMLAQRALPPPGPVVTSPRVTELLTGRHQEVRTRLEPPAQGLHPWSSVEVLAVASPPSRDNSVTFEKKMLQGKLPSFGPMLHCKRYQYG